MSDPTPARVKGPEEEEEGCGEEGKEEKQEEEEEAKYTNYGPGSQSHIDRAKYRENHGILDHTNRRCTVLYLQEYWILTVKLQIQNSTCFTFLHLADAAWNCSVSVHSWTLFGQRAAADVSGRREYHHTCGRLSLIPLVGL